MIYNKKLFSIIKSFEEGTSTGIFLKPKKFSGVKNAKLFMENGELVVEFNYSDSINNIIEKFNKGRLLKKIYFEGKTSYILFDVFIGSIYPPFAKGYVHKLQSKSFNKNSNYYFKVIIPVSKKINFFYQIERDLSYNSNATKVTLKDESILIFSEKDNEDNYYLIIESNKKQPYSSFADKVFSIRVALSYLIGLFAGNKAYVFGYSSKEMKVIKNFQYFSLRKEMQSMLNPINSNPYSWIRDKKESDIIYKQKILKPLSKSNLSNFVNLLNKNELFLSLVMLINESNNSSLLIRSRSFSIALEMFADLLKDKSKRFSPITSKSDNRKFRLELLEVLEKYKRKKSFVDIETLKGRINQINQLTNKERLLVPFKILDIPLLDEDVKVINSRNDFLHGRIPDFKNLGENRSIYDKDRDLYYSSLRLYVLLNMLILKYIGYNNYILNFPKIYEENTTYYLDEDYYRKL